MAVNYNVGWWEHKFGEDKTYVDGEHITSTEGFFLKFKPTSVVMESLIGLSLLVNGGDYCGAFGEDKFSNDGKWCLDFDFMIGGLPSGFVPLCSFMLDELAKAPFLSTKYDSHVLFSVILRNLGGLGYSVYVIVRDSGGIKKYWDGVNFVLAPVPVTGLMLSNAAPYRIHLEKTSSFYLSIASLITPINLVLINQSLTNVDNRGGFFVIGDTRSDTPVTGSYSINVSSIRRGKGDRTSDSFASALPDFVKFSQNIRTKSTSFSRQEFDTHVTDNYNVFLPSLRRVTIKEDSRDIYHVVSSREEGRLDLISYTYYHTTRLWWILAMVNKISEAYSVKSGLQLRIPPMDMIMKALSSLGYVYGR